MNLIRLEFDFGNSDKTKQILKDVIELGIISIEEKLDSEVCTDIILNEDYTLQTKFYTRCKEHGIAVVYKDKLTLNIYPSSICLTTSFKDLESLDKSTLSHVESVLRDEALSHVKEVLKVIINFRKGVISNEE